MTENKSKFKYNEVGVDELINELISSDDSLRKYYSEKFKEEYQDDSSRNYYIDIDHISNYIVACFIKGETDFFPDFFNKVEYILSDCDSDTEKLIVVGLFEGIQNQGDEEIDYYFGFNNWLRPNSKSKWDNLIDSWEGTGWRKRNL